ncbi:MAG: DUF4147 domain-containing protein [Thermoplasmata archaeon]
MENSVMREITMNMINSGVEGADPLKLLSTFVAGRSLVLSRDTTYHNEDFREVLLFAVGKASQRMALAFKGWDIDDGLIITDRRADLEKINLPIRRCSHPLPSKENILASQEILSILEEKKDALILFLISGGASSLFCLPEENISLEDLTKLNRMLLHSGASIHEINTVRKHISQVKGGKFARLCENKGKLISLIISDVPGDELSDIGSGPTVGDKTTFQDAKEVLKRYFIWESTPRSVKEHIDKGVMGKIRDTPEKTNDHNVLVGCGLSALKAAVEEGKKHGITSMILSSQNQGEAAEVAKTIMAIAKECQDCGQPAEPPVALLLGGEMTTRMEKEISHPGGPNREFALSAAIEIKGRSDIVVAAVDTDGVDGRGKAGAIADCNSVNRSTRDPFKLLNEHRSQEFFDALEDSIELPVTNNVNDLIVVLVGNE